MSPVVAGIEPFHLWNIATAMAVAAPCALVGTLLVARRLSLLGDAIAHAVLPGIVVAVLAGGRPGGWLTMIGAVAAAIVTASIATAVSSNSIGVGEDAATGVGFTTMFALGVILVSVAASRVDLDTACVLYGELELSAFDTVPVVGLEIPRGFITGCLLFAGVGLALWLTWKEQVLAAFDPAAARALGLPVTGLSVALLVGTALTTVSGRAARRPAPPRRRRGGGNRHGGRCDRVPRRVAPRHRCCRNDRRRARGLVRRGGAGRS
jgi:manganese/zinc/iron transport system permease protein